MEYKQESAAVTIGTRLREARERLGMSIDDVAARLKFAPRQISALEEGNLGKPGEMAFVRGFVRSYARLLQLDETPLLALLPSAPAQAAVSQTGAKEAFLPSGSGARTQNVMWLGGALVVALVIGLLAWQHEGPEAPKPAPTANPRTETGLVLEAASGVAADSGPAGAETVAAAEQATAAEQAKPAEAARAPQAAKSGTGANVPGMAPVVPVSAPAAARKAQEPAKRAGASAVAAAKPAAPKPASGVAAAKPASAKPASAVAAAKAGGRQLRLEFDEDSWVEVRDGNGKLLLGMLGKQGTAQIVGGAPPLSVTIGNAKGVRLYYKGEPVDLAPESEANVAHLILE